MEEEAGSDVEIESACDSDYNSECDGIDIHIQNIDTADIIAMNDDTKICAIHIYYKPWDDVCKMFPTEEICPT